jgi:selenocysteine-specific elongation factor
VTTLPPLILGTAGHIDHGKTTLVRTLTGIDTDRLPQERDRGISIDLGFAHLDLAGRRFGIVDVPGHERFVKNMLAGSAGIDIALLVIAADDGVMPQTREHLAILELLRVRHGLVVITKADLVDADWLDLVREDVTSLLAGTFLEGAPMIATSTQTGAGFDELRAAITSHAACIEQSSTGDLFRLAIDRAFVLEGVGTVVTGTVSSGALTVGEEVECLPQARRIRVRGLQQHGRSVERVERGQRASLDLAGVHHTEIERGNELATPGWLRPAHRLTVEVRVLDNAPWPLKHRARVRLHVAAQEVMARVNLVSAPALEPGERGLAQLITAEPTVACGGQPYVLRAESPVLTIGGGTILEPVAERIGRRDEARQAAAARLRADDPGERVAAVAALYGHLVGWTDLDIARDAGVDLAHGRQIVHALVESGELVVLGDAEKGNLRIERRVLLDLEHSIAEAVAALHQGAPLVARHAPQRIAERLHWIERELVDAVIQRMVEAGTLVGDARGIARAGFAPALSAEQQRLRTLVETRFRDAAFRPPDEDELASDAGVAASRLRPIVELCVGENTLAHLGSGLYLHSQWHAELRTRIEDGLAGTDGLTLSEIRQLLDTSRKYAVPICEYLDRTRITRRIGDRRVLASG